MTCGNSNVLPTIIRTHSAETEKIEFKNKNQELGQDWSIVFASLFANNDFFECIINLQKIKKTKGYRYKAMGTSEKVHSLWFYFKGNMWRCCDILKGKILEFRKLRHCTQTCYYHTSLSFLSLKNDKMSLLLALCILMSASLISECHHTSETLS